MEESVRIKSVQSPIIPVVGRLIQETPGTISLGQGVVNYPPPPQAVESIKAFLGDPENHKYKPVQGISRLTEAIGDKLQNENGITTGNTMQVVVTAGGNMGFMNAILAIADPGDEIILQLPYYFNHEMAITIAGCKAVCVPTDENYRLQTDKIKKAITSRTRAVVTVSPNNPTGAVYAPSTLHEVNTICRRCGIYHISDEAYEYFTYAGAEHFSPASAGDTATHTISLFSLSKAYGFASWRIGYMVIPEHLVTSVKKIQDTILICPPVVSQWAALGALEAGAEYCLEKLKTISEIRRIVLDKLKSINNVTIPTTRGAFYFFLRIHTDVKPMQLVKRLIREYGVAVIPGTTFGIQNGCYLRVAFGALEKKTVTEGIGRLARGLRKIA